MKYSVLSKYRSELMGVAMLWVMAFHAFDLSFGVAPLDFLRAAGFGGVDIFILVSAMGLAMSLDKKEQEYASFMSRRAARILPAYYLVMVAYTLFCIVREKALWSTLIWNGSLLYYWIRPQGAFNWYVAGIMLFYALTPWCFRMLKVSAHRERLVAFEVCLALLVCQLLMQDGYWFHLDIPYRFPVFFMGLLLGLYVRSDRAISWKGAAFWTFWMAAGGCYLVATQKLSGHGVALPLCHLFVFTTVPMCLVLCWCFARLPLGMLRRGLRVVGEHSLEIYLLNVSFFAETALLQQYLDFGPGHYIYYAITIPLNLVLGVLLHHGMQAGQTLLARRAAAK